MGTRIAPTNCFLFDLPTINIDSRADKIEYEIEWDKTHYSLSFDWDYKNSKFIEDNKHVLKGLLLNNKFTFEESDFIYDDNHIVNLIKNALIPITPKEKLDNLLQHIHKNQKFEGDNYSFHLTTNLTNKLYFKNNAELRFYIETLFDMNLIFRSYSSTYYQIHSTFKGLEYIIKIEDEGINSKKCFIAMSFSEEAQPIRNSLKSVIIKTNFEPILIDEVNYESDVTINDAMIGFIRKCKFMIADFTHQKHGVYFEAGFALGLKKPVIYTCHADDFKSTHFDTNHYPHIVYESNEDLEQKLFDKINAWII